MIKAVIFDCFGVLTTDGWLPFKKKYFGHDKALAQQATDLNKQVDSGLIGFDEFLTQLAKLAGVTKAEAHVVIENNIANTELFAYIQQELKPKYKIGLLSNAGANWLPELFKPEQLAVFDATCLSCDTGYIKPQPQAYSAIAAKLGVEPSECIFVDDLERYVTAAREAGMQAIRFEDTEQAKRELTTLLGGREFS